MAVARALDGRLLATALLVCACFGSIHAYGVLLEPLELWLGTGRAAASLGYSAAVLALTAGVYVNGRLPGSVSDRTRLVACGVIAAGGLTGAALWPGLASLVIGFGLAYGLANGAAYGLALGIAARSMPGREATAMGIATAAYGLGAVLFAQVFDTAIMMMAMNWLLLLWAALLLFACLVGAVLAGPASAALRQSVPEQTAARSAGVVPLWTAYLLGAFGGLMVLAHAPGIAAGLSGPTASAGLASGVVSGGSVVGGYLGGVLAERLSRRWSIALPLVVQSAAVMALLTVSALSLVISALGVIGLCYGALISAVPAVVRQTWGDGRFADAYGKVFTAWGIAGLAGPAAAGFLFDLTDHYALALVAACALSLAGAVLTLRFRD
jgi:MFS family permease